MTTEVRVINKGIDILLKKRALHSLNPVGFRSGVAFTRPVAMQARERISAFEVGGFGIYEACRPRALRSLRSQRPSLQDDSEAAKNLLVSGSAITRRGIAFH